MSLRVRGLYEAFPELYQALRRPFHYNLKGSNFRFLKLNGFMALSCSNLRALSEFSYLAVQGVDNMPSEEPDTSLRLLIALYQVPSET